MILYYLTVGDGLYVQVFLIITPRVYDIFFNKPFLSDYIRLARCTLTRAHNL